MASRRSRDAPTPYTGSKDNPMERKHEAAHLHQERVGNFADSAIQPRRVVRASAAVAPAPRVQQMCPPPTQHKNFAISVVFAVSVVFALPQSAKKENHAKPACFTRRSSV